MHGKLKLAGHFAHEKKVDMDNELFLKNHKTRLSELLSVDATNLPASAQKQHTAKIKYLQSVIETVVGLQEIISDRAKTYRNELLTPEEKLKIMETVNPKIITLIQKLDLKLLT